MSPCSTSTVARASCRARWSGVVGEPKTCAREDSRWLGDSSRTTSWRASCSVSRTVKPGHGLSVSDAADLRKPMSKPALWATRTLPAANSRNAGKALSMRGASATMPSVMPVRTEMKAGMGSAGLTRVWNSPRTSPPRTLTAPISVMPHCAGVPPVVSRSTTTNVTPASGVPRSSNVAWKECMATTVGGGADNDAEACRSTSLRPWDIRRPYVSPGRRTADLAGARHRRCRGDVGGGS